MSPTVSVTFVAISRRAELSITRAATCLDAASVFEAESTATSVAVASASGTSDAAGYGTTPFAASYVRNESGMDSTVSSRVTKPGSRMPFTSAGGVVTISFSVSPSADMPPEGRIHSVEPAPSEVSESTVSVAESPLPFVHCSTPCPVP